MDTYNIVDFGASVTNSAPENGKAIQAAVCRASAAGGGTVYIPAGRYVTTSVRLYSHVRLYVSAGAQVVGSEDFHHYEFSSAEYPCVEMMGVPSVADDSYWCAVFYAENEENIEICGTGTIDGQGMDHLYFPHPDDPYQRRPLILLFDRCSNIRVSGITLKDPAMWAFLGSRSDTLLLENVRVFSWQTENGDGLDFNGCTDVIVRSCIITAGDDAISLKATNPQFPCKNILISNCIFRSVWAGFRMGTESSADMQDIILSDCIFEECNDGLKIQDCSTGVYENVMIRNISMRNVHRPLFMTTGSFRLSKKDTSIRPSLGGIRNVTIDGMRAYMSREGAEYQRNCMVISGCPQKGLENITLRNVEIYFSGQAEPDAMGRVDVPEYLDYSFLYTDVFSINGNYPASGIFLRHVEGLTMQDCRLIRQDEDQRPLLWGYHLRRIQLRNVCSIAASPFFMAEDSEISFADCRCNEQNVSAAEPFPAHLQERFQQFLTCSAHTDQLLDRLSKTVDAAQACPVRTRYDSDIWQKNGALWQAKLKLSATARWLLLVSFGDVDVYLNDTLAGSCVLPPLYQNLCAWALPVDAFAGSDVQIQLRWHDPDAHGGSICKLPFGEFTGLRTGLYGALSVYED